jgi:hypothetical protein
VLTGELAFMVTLHDERDEPVGESSLFPALPYPGLRIFWEGEAWEVLNVMAFPPHPRASNRHGPAFEASDDVQATGLDVRCARSSGIHDS